MDQKLKLIHQCRGNREGPFHLSSLFKEKSESFWEKIESF